MKAYTKHRVIEADGTPSKMDITVDQPTQSLRIEIKTMPFILAFENIEAFCAELKQLAQENRKSLVVDNNRANMEDEADPVMLKVSQEVVTANTAAMLSQQEIKGDE